MDTHHFTLSLRGADVLTATVQDALREAGCRDARFGERDGVQYAEFEREAKRKTRLWSWPEVARWLVQHDKAQVVVETRAADLVAAYNAALKVREHARNLRKRDRALIAETLEDQALPEE